MHPRGDTHVRIHVRMYMYVCTYVSIYIYMYDYLSIPAPSHPIPTRILPASPAHLPAYLHLSVTFCFRRVRRGEAVLATSTLRYVTRGNVMYQYEYQYQYQYHPRFCPCRLPSASTLAEPWSQVLARAFGSRVCCRWRCGHGVSEIVPNSLFWLAGWREGGREMD